MKRFYFCASRNAVGIDFECIIEADEIPDFWTQYELADINGCEFFDCTEMSA